MSLQKLPLPKDAIALDAALRYLMAAGGRDFLLPADESKQFALETLDKVMRMSDVGLAQAVWKRLDQGFPEKIILLANSEESRAFRSALMVTRENPVTGHVPEEIFPVILAPVNNSPRQYLLRTFKNIVFTERIRPERKQAQIELALEARQRETRRDGLGNDLDFYCDGCTERMENAADCLQEEVLIDMERTSPKMAEKARLIRDGMPPAQVALHCRVTVAAVSQAWIKYRKLLNERRSAPEAVPRRPATSEVRAVNAVNAVKEPLQR